MAMTLEDELLENLIKTRLLLMSLAYRDGNHDQARFQFREAVNLANQRSPERVRQMEQEKGLV